ncbi:hypothetical protein V8E55_007012 [Tylopilus felleus]
MLPTMTTLWSVAAATQGLVDNYSGLLTCRCFLGLLEGVDLPRHRSVHSSVGQVVSFQGLFSISLLSILANDYKYDIRDISLAVHNLIFALEL